MGVIDCDAHVEESDPEFYCSGPIPLVFPEDTCFGVHNAARDSTAKAQGSVIIRSGYFTFREG